MVATHQPDDRRAIGRRHAMWTMLAALLAAPLVAMRFTGEVRWDASDFAAAALLLTALGLAIELASRLLPRPATRWPAIALAVIAATVIWADGAVGIF